LSSVAWKKVDYIWLAMALLGILGSVGTVRAVVAKNLLAVAETRAKSDFEQLEQAVTFGTGGAICRVFIRTEASPPPKQLDQVQYQYDSQCAWFNALALKLKAFSTSYTVPIDVVKLAGAPPEAGDRWTTEHVQYVVSAYNATIQTVESLKAESDADVLVLLQVLGPTLLAAALALRVTKVSGEIAIDRRRGRN